jgi:hypothetical protein
MIVADNANYDFAERLSSVNGLTTYRAILKSTREAVFVHELPRGTAELYDLALKHFCSQSIDRPILDLFTIEGISYVVTRPQKSTIPLLEWLVALPLDSREREEGRRTSRARVDSAAVPRTSDSLKSKLEKDMAASGEPSTRRAVEKSASGVVSGRSRLADWGHKTVPIESAGPTLDTLGSRLPGTPVPSVEEPGEFTKIFPKGSTGDRDSTLKSDVPSSLSKQSCQGFTGHGSGDRDLGSFTDVFELNSTSSTDDGRTADMPGRKHSSPLSGNQRQEGHGTFPVGDYAPPVSENIPTGITKDEEGNFEKYFPPDSVTASSKGAGQLGPESGTAVTPDDKPAFGDATAIFRSPLAKSSTLSGEKLAGEYTQFYDRRGK